MRSIGGFIKEALNFKDWSYEKAFSQRVLTVSPIGRSIDGIPVISQGKEPSCISCAVTWIKQWMEREDHIQVALSWRSLSVPSGTNIKGARPSKVLEHARTVGIGVSDDGKEAELHKIPGYFFLANLSKENIYSALLRGVLMIGVDDFQFMGPHMMAGFDVTDDGENLICANWKTENKQAIAIVPFEQVSFACLIAEKPTDITECRLPFKQLVLSKLTHLFA